MSTDQIIDHILHAARMAQAGQFGVLSTGEKLAAALVLNRADWLAEERYTMAEAIERGGKRLGGADTGRCAHHGRRGRSLSALTAARFGGRYGGRGRTGNG